MFTITQIEPVTGGRGRARVYLDGAFAFVLYNAELRKYGVSEGAELSDETYAEITQTVLPLRAKKRAMHLLEKRPYTEKALRDKLAGGDYPDACIDTAVEYVKSYGYINDLQYAIDHVSYHIADRPRRRLEIDLLKKGIDKAVIAEAFEAVYAEAAGTRRNGALPEAGDARTFERDMIRKELRKKHFDPDNPEEFNFETRTKLLASLVRKGFDPELVRDVMRES